MTGVPAPVGAGLAFLPMYLWLATDKNEIFREPVLVGAWLVVIAFLMISSVATMGWSAIRPRKRVRLELIALIGLIFAALLTDPWWTLAAICAFYIAMLPVGIVRYARVKRQRAARAGIDQQVALP
jgi:CDP-diacylglycerol--serine O-phosphatidyltransferase